jgi:hypothetical protein
MKKEWSLSDELKYVTKSVCQAFNPVNWSFGMQMSATLFLLDTLTDTAEATSYGPQGGTTPHWITTAPTALSATELFDIFSDICKAFSMLKYAATGEYKKQVMEWAVSCIEIREYLRDNMSPLSRPGHAELSVYTIEFNSREEQNNFERGLDDSCRNIETISAQMIQTNNCTQMGAVLAGVVDVFTTALTGCIFWQDTISTDII